MIWISLEGRRAGEMELQTLLWDCFLVWNRMIVLFSWDGLVVLFSRDRVVTQCCRMN
jgi:hypothetical protein